MNKAIILFSMILFLLNLGGCGVTPGQIIKKSTLSEDEAGKVKTVEEIEADKLNLNTYKKIKSVQGLSCTLKKTIVRWSGILPTPKYTFKTVENASRKKAVEQLKIHAVKSGGNAIANVVCLRKKQPPLTTRDCMDYVLCTADVLQVD